MGAGRRCAAIGATVERLPLSAKVPTRYTPGASWWCDRPAKGRRSVRRRSARPGSTSRRSGSRVVRDGRVVAVGSSGPEQWRLRPRGFSQQAESKKSRCRRRAGHFGAPLGPVRCVLGRAGATQRAIAYGATARLHVVGPVAALSLIDRGGIAVGDCRKQACPTPAAVAAGAGGAWSQMCIGPATWIAAAELCAARRAAAAGPRRCGGPGR
jgi:hypothetical protein